jgi:hypothetical protein
MLRKKIWANFQRIIEVFTQKTVTKLSKIWVSDSGSKMRDRKKTYSGSRIQGSKRHRVPDPDPQHWFEHSPDNLRRFWKITELSDAERELSFPFYILLYLLPYFVTEFSILIFKLDPQKHRDKRATV